MPRFAANLSLLFTEFPYLERFEAAARAGFRAVEILFPYEFPAGETRRALISNDLELVLINAPPPNYTGGDQGFAGVPGGEARFQYDMRRVMRFAGEFHPGVIHLMSGYSEDPAAVDVLVQNLQWAADMAPMQQFTIEPLNRTDQPGYVLSDFDLAAEVLARVGRDNVGLQFDTYHAQVIHGDALAVWDRVAPLVRHVQVGDLPGRVEPGGGHFDFRGFFEMLDATGYAGWVSAEYHPRTKLTKDSLGWMR